MQETRKPKPLPPMPRDLAEPPPRESAAAGDANPSGRCVVITSALGSKTLCASGAPPGLD